MTSTEVGLKTVSASLADKPTEVISRLLNASADVNSATITSLEIPEGQLMVAQDVAVKAHVNDQFGNPILNESVTLSAEPPEHMTISQNIVSTDTHGIAEVSMTPERNGSYMVKASWRMEPHLRNNWRLLMKTDTHGVQSAYRCLCPYRHYSDGNANLCKWHSSGGSGHQL